MKRRFLHIPLALLLIPVLALGWGVGCDSDGDDTPDAELIRGTWVAERASVQAGLLSVPVIEDDSEADLTLSFESGDVFVLMVEGPVEVTAANQTFELLADGERFAAEGTYVLVETEGTLRFTPDTVNGQPVGEPGTAEVEYDLRNGADDLVLSVDNPEQAQALIAFLTGSEELASLVTGFEGSFDRD